MADADRDDAVFETLRDLGLPEEAVRRAVERGRPEDAIFEAVLLPEIAERTLSANDVVARGGPSLTEIEGFWDAFGLPIDDPDEPRFSEEEAEIFKKLNAMQDVWPVEVGLQIARVYGRLLARIAQAEIQVFREFVHPRLRSEDDDPVAAMLATRDAFAQLLPTTGPLLLGVHRRWVEHHIAQELVGVAEGETNAGLPGTVRVSLLFCDLKDFTAFAQERGDGAAVAAIDCFAQVVSHERGPEVRFTKALGDGYMLVYANAVTALEVGQRVIAALRESAVETPTVHASAHTGTAIAREGDYFGGAVNLAARLLDAAAGDELVATAATVEAGGDAFEWDPAGSVGVRGVPEPVEVFRLRC